MHVHTALAYFELLHGSETDRVLIICAEGAGYPLCKIIDDITKGSDRFHICEINGAMYPMDKPFDCVILDSSIGVGRDITDWYKAEVEPKMTKDYKRAYMS